jgi:ferric-dicitrate binding protein FerR (iron transport regulator)
VSLTLADGTKVWLNAESSLHYPISFKGSERKVRVTGEAYFEVAKNAAKKFIVDAGGVTTEVLGTHFNVNAYKEEGRTVITLLEGAVRVKKPGASAVIRPGQQAIVAQNIRIVKDADMASVMAWKNGEFIMKSADVGSIMRQVARWYNVDIIYQAGVPAARISGEVSRNLDLSQILQVLKYSGIHVKMENRRVIVMP